MMAADTSNNTGSEDVSGALAEDEALAFKSFRRAADNGHADAAYCVAKMCLSGVGCEVNLELCRRYVKQAAESGHADAMVLYALLLLADNLFMGECPEALRLMHRSAELGNPYAYGCLGQMYSYGIGVPKDAVKGGEYLCLAAGHGCDVSDSVLMNGIDKYGWPVEPQLRRELIESLRRSPNESLQEFAETAEWQDIPTVAQLQHLGKAIGNMVASPVKRKFIDAACALMNNCPPEDLYNNISRICDAASQGVVGASTFLASLYLQGGIVPKDVAQAVQLLQDDADMGWPQAMYMLSKLYDSGDGIPRDPQEAWRYAQMAADRDHVDAQFAVGQMYRLGHNTEQDLPKAVHYLRCAADEGHPAAMYILAFMYFRGEGVEQNVKRCVGFLKRAVAAGHTEAMISLAEFYQGGLGIPADPEAALHLLSQAAEKGSARAEEMLERMYGELGDSEV
ncbi:MAG: tetratricopeptide repeat protein [bacterium]|nr:tetratricopeptide repeat protein [bacterium]